jgi:hypothetical protein
VLPVFEQPDYDDFIQRRVDCAKPKVAADDGSLME